MGEGETKGECSLDISPELMFRDGSVNSTDKSNRLL